MLHITAWNWGTKYAPVYTQRLANSVRRNLSGDYTFRVCEPDADDAHLTTIPGCFARLRTFDPAWQRANDIEPGDRIVCLDLDMVVTGNLDGLFDRPEPFVILQGVNAVNPCPYNGSAWMLTAGYAPQVWSDFTLEAANEVPWYAFPDDQSWMAAKLPNAGAWGPQDGVYGFEKPGWPRGRELPPSARLVAFFGARDPSQFAALPWVRDHWR